MYRQEHHNGKPPVGSTPNGNSLSGSFEHSNSCSPSSSQPSLANMPPSTELPRHYMGLTASRAGSFSTEHCKFGYHLAVPMGKRTPGLEKASSNFEASSTPHVIAMVGLPARGKTYISKKLSRYLNWIGINTKVFNLGDYRRKESVKYSDHHIFDPENKEGRELRDRVCQQGLEDVMDWLENCDGEVAVFDATNTTRERRKFLYNKVVLEKGYKLFFVESICDDNNIVDSNIKEVKVTSPDYVAYSADQVVTDFQERIKHYAKQYEEIDEVLEPEYSFLKIFNAGTKIMVHKHEGHIQSRIVYYLMNVHITPRTIFLTRHGESLNNVEGRIGGDSVLSQRGEEFALKLNEYVSELSKDHPKLKVWTSWMRRTIDTAKHIPGVQERWKTLNEIDSGVCDDLTYEEMKHNWPKDFVARDLDKYRYRYPRGESYEDLVARLEPVIMEMERQDSVLVVAHQAVNRCLLGYFMEVSEDELPWQEVPLHTVFKLTPKAYGCNLELIPFAVDCVSTHRPKPEVPGFLDDRFRRDMRPKLENLKGIEQCAEDLFGQHNPINEIVIYANRRNSSITEPAMIQSLEIAKEKRSLEKKTGRSDQQKQVDTTTSKETEDSEYQATRT